VRGVKEVLAGQMDVVAFPERDLLAVIRDRWELDRGSSSGSNSLKHPLQPGSDGKCCSQNAADNLQKHAGDTHQTVR